MIFNMYTLNDERKIYKYPIEIHDHHSVGENYVRVQQPRKFKIKMPEGAKILAFKMQGDKASLWALIAPYAPEVERHFLLIGTGKELEILEANLKYIDLIIIDNTFVWHLFEII